MTRPEYLLAELRCASLRARLLQADIDAVGIALKSNIITAEQAIDLLIERNLLWYVEPVVPAAGAGASS